MSKKSRRPGRRGRKSTQPVQRIAGNHPATFDQFRDRALALIGGFPDAANLRHMLLTWTGRQGIVAADPFQLIGTEGMDSFAGWLPNYLADVGAKAAAFASNGWVRSINDEDEARLIKRTRLNEPNIQRHPAVIVEISDGDRTEEWSAPLLNGRVVGWRKQGSGPLEFTAADDESAVRVVANAFRSLKQP